MTKHLTLAGIALLAALIAQATPPKSPGVFDIRSFGAVADDGRDDQPALQKALDTAAVGGGLVLIPGGVFNLNHPAHVWGQKVTIRGESPTSVLRGGDGHAGAMLMIGMPTRRTPAGARFQAPPGTYDGSAGDRTPINTTGYVLAASGHPFQYGRGTERTGPDGWSGTDPIGFDCYFGRPAGVDWADGTHLWGIADDQMAPAPFIFKAVEGGFALHVRMADGTIAKLAIAADRTASRWRISGQYDPVTGEGAAWVEHRAVGRGRLTEPGQSIARGDGLAPFMIGGCRYNANLSPAEQAPQLIYALRLTRGANYHWDGGQAFLGDPRAINDDLQFFTPYPTTEPDAARVGFLPLNDGGDTGGTVSTLSPGARQQLVYCPALDPAVYPPIATQVRIEDVDIQGTGQAPVHVGRVLDLAIDRTSITLAAQGIGNFPLGNSYPVKLTDCKVGGWDAAVVANDWIMDTVRLQIPAAGRDAIRLKGGYGEHTSLYVWRSASWTDTIVKACGSDDGLSLKFSGFILDNEEENVGPNTGVFHFTSAAFQTGCVELDRINPSTVPGGCALLHLVGRGLKPPFRGYQVELKRPGVFNLRGPLVRQVGDGWSGTIDAALTPGATTEGNMETLTVKKAIQAPPEIR